jgi:glucoamylase
MGLISRFDDASDGNVVQCGEIGGVGADTTFTLSLGYGGDAARALAAAEGSLAAGFPERETAYRKGWSDYVDGLRSAPSSVSADTLAGGFTIQRLWRCMPPRTKHSVAPP